MEKEFAVNKKQLDQDWVELILDAMDMGMSVQEIKDFFTKNKVEVDMV